MEINFVKANFRKSPLFLKISWWRGTWHEKKYLRFRARTTIFFNCPSLNLIKQDHQQWIIRDFSSDKFCPEFQNTIHSGWLVCQIFCSVKVLLSKMRRFARISRISGKSSFKCHGPSVLLWRSREMIIRIKEIYNKKNNS